MKKILLLVLGLGLILGGCAGASKFTKTDMDKAVAAVKAEYGENYIPSNPINATQLEEVMKVKAADVEAFYAEGPLMSLNVDTFIAVLAKDGKVEDVKKALEDYRDYLINDGFNYPMNMDKVKATQVIVEGNLVFFLLLGNYDDRSDATDAERTEFAEAEVQRGVDAILEALK